jgi:hypothetical protein
LENGNEEEDLTSFDRLSDLIDELVIPVDFSSVDCTISFVNDRRPGSVPEGDFLGSLEEEFPISVLETDLYNGAAFEENRSLGRSLVESL